MPTMISVYHIKPMLLSVTKGCLCKITSRRAFSAHNVLQQQVYQPLDLSQRTLPLITGRKLEYPCPHREPKQAWLESLDQIEDVKLGILDLHPEVFGRFPRIDLLWENVHWQQTYKKIDYRRVKTRAEMRGSRKKPWPQKMTGRARHGDRYSPIFLGGGAAFGPRGPTSQFKILSTDLRVFGLCSALSAKFAQENLHIVDSLNLPTDNPKYLEDLIETRGWGLSVLFINDTDELSENIALALDEIDQYNAMPVYGMNVFSILKHETLVLTLPALDLIEKKLLEKIHKVGPSATKFKLST